MAASLRRSTQNFAGLFSLPRKILGSYAARKSSSLVNLQHRDNGVTIMELSRKPVNSFSLEFLDQINTTLTDLENDEQCRGLIITSSLPKVFSAGLDLVKELHNPDKERLGLFWRRFQDMWLQLYGSRLATVAAINGHAVAGGCLLASSCDYRLMASNFTIGMNETVVGIAVPWWVSQSIVNVVGYGVAERACALGTMFTSDEALRISLVDRVVKQEEIMTEASKEMEKWIAVPERGRALTKQVLRREFIQKLRSNRDEDVQAFVEHIMTESTQQCLEEQISRMSKKAKK